MIVVGRRSPVGRIQSCAREVALVPDRDYNRIPARIPQGLDFAPRFGLHPERGFYSLSFALDRSRIASGYSRVLPGEQIIFEPCYGAARVTQRDRLRKLANPYQFTDLGSAKSDELWQIAKAINSVQ
jgi:hypothetical protein